MTLPVRRSPPRAVIALLICRAAEIEKAPDTVRQRLLVLGLDDHVDVVSLDGHVK